MASIIVKVLKTSIGLAENLIKTLGPGLAVALKPLAVIGATMTASTKAVRIFGKALKKALNVSPLGKVLKAAAPVFKGLKKMATNFGKTLKSIGKIDVLDPFTSLFPIIGKSRAAFELLKGTVLQFKAATLDAYAAIEDGTRRAVTSVVSQVDLVDKATGEIINDTAEKIGLLDPKFREIQKNLIAAAPNLVGVTTKDVLDVFEQVSLNFGNLTQQLSAARAEELGLEQLIGGDGVVDDFAVAEKVTERLAASLKNAGLTARDTAQEVRAILTGDIDFNARLAKRLNLSRAEFELAKARGDVAGLLLERTEAIENANNVYNDSLENTLSVIQDVGQGFGRIFGGEIFEELRTGLASFRKRLEDNRELLDTLAKRLGAAFVPTIDRIISQINDVFDLFLENEDDVSDFLEDIIGSIGTIIEFAGLAIKSITEFVIFISTLGEKAAEVGEKLKALNPKNWFGDQSGNNDIPLITRQLGGLEKQIEDVDFDDPIEGVINFRKEVKKLNFISRIGRGLGDFFLGFEKGADLSEAPKGLQQAQILFEQTDEQIKGLSESLDTAQSRALKFGKEIREASLAGDKEKVDELTKSYLELAELDEIDLSKRLKAVGDLQGDLNDLSREFTNEQFKGLEAVSQRNIAFELQKALLLSQIPIYAEVADAEGKSVQATLQEKFALLEVTKNSEDKKRIAEQILGIQIQFIEAIKQEKKQIGAVQKLYDQNISTQVLASQSLEAAIKSLNTTGTTSQEVFNNLKNVIEKLEFADKVGGDAKDVRQIFDELGDTFERLDIADRIKALPLLTKFEAELAKVKDEEVKVEQKLIDLREARGQISTEEAKRQRASVDSNKKLLDLLKTQNQLAITRAALGAKTFNKERDLIEQLAKAAPAERKSLLLKLEQLRITDKIGGTEVAILNNKRRQQTIDLILQDTRNEALNSELKILEAIREQNIARGERQVAEAEFDFKVDTSGAFLEPIRRAKELQMIILEGSNELTATTKARLKAEERIAKIISGELEVSDDEFLKAQEQKNDLVREEFKLKGEIDAAFIEQATKQAELDMLALERDREVEQLTLQTNKLLNDGARTLEQSLANTERGLVEISKQEIDIKIDAANALAKFKNEIQSGELEIIDPAAVRNALAEIEGEAEGLVKKIGDTFIVDEKKVADLIKKKGDLELKILKAKNKSEQNSIKFRIREIQLAERLAEIENEKLLKEQEIERLRLEAAKDNARKRFEAGELTNKEYQEQLEAIEDQIDFVDLVVKGINEQTEAQKAFDKELKNSLKAELALAEANGESEEKIQGLKNALAAVEANTKGAAVAANDAADAAERNAKANKESAEAARAEANAKRDSQIADFAMSKQKRTGPTFRTGFDQLVGDETFKQYKAALSQLGEDGLKVFQEALSKAGREINERSVAFRGGPQSQGQADLAGLISAQNEQTRRAIQSVIGEADKREREAQVAEQQRNEQEQAIRDAERQRETLAREEERRQTKIANARDSLLKRLVSEARQARLAELQLEKDQLQEQINTKESIEQGFADLTESNKAQVFTNAKLVAEQFGGADEAAEEQQIFAALVDTFGEKTANALRGIVEIDEKILQQLKDGTVRSEDLTKDNKIFLDPETGELIVTGADPDFEKLQQLIELQAIRSTEEKALNVLNGIEDNTSALLAINKAVDAGRIGTEGVRAGVLFNDDGQAIGAIDLSLPPKEIAAVLAEVEEENAKIAAKIAQGTLDRDPRVQAFQDNFDEFTKIIAKNSGLSEDLIKGVTAQDRLGRIDAQIEEINSNAIKNELENLAADANISLSKLEALKEAINKGFQNFGTFADTVTDIETGDPAKISDVPLGTPADPVTVTPTIDPSSTPIKDVPRLTPSTSGPRSAVLGAAPGTNSSATPSTQTVSPGTTASSPAANSTGFGTSRAATLGNSVVQNYLANTYNYFPSTVGSERLLASSSGR